MKKLIITAASAAYGPSLLAMLGSLNLNWPNHPPVRVYDIGLDVETLKVLDAHGFSVRKVPAFCPHWRKHFTWKIWCFNDVEANAFLWMDAGLIVLQPLVEPIDMIDKYGYFAVPNYHLLDWEAPTLACEGCGLPPDFRNGKLTFATGLIGFQRSFKNTRLLKEAMQIALKEKYIKATKVTHRHEQAILSLLLYKYYNNPIFSDGLVYLGWKSPKQVPGQKVWVHRRKLMPEDQAYLSSKIVEPGDVFFPKDPVDCIAQERFIFKIIRRVLGIVRRFFKRASSQSAQPYNGVRE